MNVHSVILCGGPGARLWPESTATRPKPFIDLIGDRSLFQATVARMARVSGGRAPVIITGLAHVEEVRRQLLAMGSEGVILAEPEGRDSGPALLAAAAWIAREDPSAIVVAVASDHHIPDGEAFADAVRAALTAADGGDIVTFGVRPLHAATGYGYIRAAAPLSDSSPVRRIDTFIEKPDLTRARTLIEEGCLWNSGNFMFSARTLLAEAARYAPEMSAAVEAALVGAAAREGFHELGPAFRTAPRTAIDVAVMEKTRRAAVLPISYSWSDLGAWDSVWEASDRDAAGNATSGLAVLSESEGCLVRAGPGARVVAMGVRRLAIVARDGDILVADMDALPGLKAALGALPNHPAPGPTDLETHARRLSGWLDTSALPVWWCFGADHGAGGFHESLRPDLTPTGASRRARVQARQAFVYADAGLAGWSGPWRAAVAHGLDYLFASFRRPDGLYRSSVTPAGEPLDETALLYDQAFVLFALAHASQALPERSAELTSAAEELLSAVRRSLAHSEGGFRAGEGAPAYLANPLMHLFEAALAWMATGSDGPWRGLASEIAELFFGRLYDAGHGRIREVFDDRWVPIAGANRAIILEPGHHFEWSWLMDRWALVSGDPRASRAADALFLSGERGVDPVSDLVYDGLFDDFSVQAPTSRLWPQTERIKAALSRARREDADRASCLRVAASAAAGLERYLQTPTPGLWTDEPGSGGVASSRPSPASSFYHIVGAVRALGAL